MKPKVIVIAGPTASGKTALSIELAKRIDGEIISSDSMQIYKDMDIGTAKVTKEEMQGIKHYLVDFLSPTERYSVSSFKKDAESAIEEILKKGKTPKKTLDPQGLRQPSELSAKKKTFSRRVRKPPNPPSPPLSLTNL